MSKNRSKKGIPSTGNFISFSDVSISNSSSSISEFRDGVPGIRMKNNDSTQQLSQINEGIAGMQPIYTGENEDLSSISKKLLKKDSVTRVKAFYELINTIKTLSINNAIEDITSFVSHFCYVYLRLSSDNDRKVREMVNLSFLTIIVSLNSPTITSGIVDTEISTGNGAVEGVTALNKALGPFMKAIIGPWWVAASDSCNEVSMSAIKAFDAAIPSKKKKKVKVCTQFTHFQSLSYL